MSRAKLAAAISLICLLPACSTTRPQSAEEGPSRSPAEISELYTDLATSALVNDDLPRAIENLRTALKYNSDNAVAHNHLGLALIGMGKRDDARIEYERAISINSKYSDALVNLGTWHFGKSDFITARHYYNQALENLEYKSRFLPLTSLGHIELVQGNREQARKFLYEALAENPEYCLAHMLMGHLYDKESRFDKARDEYRQSIRGVCAKNSEGQYQLGMVYLKLKDYKGARSQFTQIMDSFPSTAMADLAGERIKDIP
jgi:Tfp pilus assembly protein PilF